MCSRSHGNDSLHSLALAMQARRRLIGCALTLEDFARGIAPGPATDSAPISHVGTTRMSSSCFSLQMLLHGRTSPKRMDTELFVSDLRCPGPSLGSSERCREPEATAVARGPVARALPEQATGQVMVWYHCDWWLLSVRGSTLARQLFWLCAQARHTLRAHRFPAASIYIN